MNRTEMVRKCWIDIQKTKKLPPNDNTRIAIYDENGGMELTFAGVAREHMLRSLSCFAKITHWMPLTKPKGVGNG